MESCKDVLVEKPDQSLLVPKTLEDFQAILDNFTVMNNGTPGLTNISSDDYITTDNGWAALTTPVERNSYIWSEDVYENWTDIDDWNKPYKQVFYCNIVLDGLNDLNRSVNIELYDRLKASALFYRSFAYYGLLQSFSPAYNKEKANLQPGIPMRNSSDINLPSEPLSLKVVYEKLMDDLLIAMTLLPDKTYINTRLSKLACYALMSRVFLMKGEFADAEKWASKALKIQNILLDYNSLPIGSARPFPQSFLQGNEEVIYYAAMTSYSFHRASLTFVNPNLYSLYEEGDLRNDIFYYQGSSGHLFKGSYTGTVATFSGISTNELYLTRAECRARLGNVSGSVNDINLLLKKRYKPDKFIKVTIEDSSELLAFILQERRKELVGRGGRWADLKRLNEEGKYSVVIDRIVNGVQYELTPNDFRYSFPVPGSESFTN